MNVAVLFDEFGAGVKECFSGQFSSSAIVRCQTLVKKVGTKNFHDPWLRIPAHCCSFQKRMVKNFCNELELQDSRIDFFKL